MITPCDDGDLTFGFVQFTTVTNCVDTLIQVDSDLVLAAGCKVFDTGLTACELLVTALEAADDAGDGDDNTGDASE
jgi:hypothetical protein